MSGAPLVELQDHAGAGRSGEFICATSTLEVHVFLQRGRVAWATDSAHPFEFARSLKARRNIDDQTFREVVETCRRDRLPLGETLVEWDLASWGDVQAALAHQLRLALASLARCSVGSTVFLERHNYARYDEKLTFDVRELVGALASEEPVPSARTTATGSTARQLLDIIKGSRWVQLVEEGRVVDDAGASQEALDLSDISRLTLGDGADFVAVRSADGCLLGAQLAGTRRQLWTMLAIDSTFGAAVAALSAAGVLSRRQRHDTPLELGAWRREPTSPLPAIDQVFSFGRDVLGAVLLSTDERTAGIGRAGLDEARCVSLARRRAPLFGILARSKAPGALGALGFDLRTLVTGDGPIWCFGAETFGAEPWASAWVFTARQGSQGIGWACLTTLSRSISKGDQGAE